MGEWERHWECAHAAVWWCSRVHLVCGDSFCGGDAACGRTRGGFPPGPHDHLRSLTPRAGRSGRWWYAQNQTTAAYTHVQCQRALLCSRPARAAQVHENERMRERERGRGRGRGREGESERERERERRDPQGQERKGQTNTRNHKFTQTLDIIELLCRPSRLFGFVDTTALAPLILFQS